jgi:hypothetical protein
MYRGVAFPDTWSSRSGSQAMIHDEIRHLLDAPTTGAGAPTLATIEHTLTAGYAEALALEAERWRIERRIAEVAAELGDGAAARADELAGLGRRMSATDSELAGLRALLDALRDRAAAVRSAAA